MTVKGKPVYCLPSAHTQSLEAWGALGRNVKFHMVKLPGQAVIGLHT